ARLPNFLPANCARAISCWCSRTAVSTDYATSCSHSCIRDRRPRAASDDCDRSGSSKSITCHCEYGEEFLQFFFILSSLHAKERFFERLNEDAKGDFSNAPSASCRGLRRYCTRAFRVSRSE